MYYHESGAFDKTPLTDAKENNFIPQQPVEPGSDNGENNDLLLWFLLALGGIGVFLFIKNLDSTPQTGM